MRKIEAIKVLTTCAKEYEKNLAGKNLLFVFGNPQTPLFFEAVFNPINFMHLTGIKFNIHIENPSLLFYKKCLTGQLRENEIAFNPNGTTPMKLRILPQIMKIHRTAKMIGDYNSSGFHLQTEKLAGTLTSCLGFTHVGNYYFPNTALQADIRDITAKPQKQVLAIFRKSIKELTYNEVCYTAKKIELKDISFPREIRSIISELALTTPRQPQATTADPGQPQATTTVPGQPQATTVVPEQPQATTVVPEQPQATTAVPGQPQATTAVPGQPQASMKNRLAMAQTEADQRNGSHDSQKIDHEKSCSKEEI